MTVPDWIPALIAWLGVAVSFVFSRRAQRSSERANQIQEEILRVHSEAEADRKQRQKETSWVCNLMRDKSRAVLSIECAGPAPATNVEILVDGHPPGHAGILREESGHAARMVDGSLLKFAYAVASGTPRIRQVTVNWDDPKGERRSFTTAV